MNLGLQLTELCAPGCGICAAAGRARSLTTARSLTVDGVEKALLEARALGIRRVVFSGGEPLLHEWLNDAVELAIRMQVDVEVVATGYRLDQREPALRKLGKRLVRLTAEFHGGTAATHDRVTGRAGSFDEARGVLECANELGVPGTARLVPTIHATREIDAWRQAVARFKPELIVDRETSHLPREATDLSEETVRCGDRDGRMLAAVAASGRVHPCLPSMGAACFEEETLPLIEDGRLRDSLRALEKLPRAGRCEACAGAFTRTAAPILAR